MAVLLILAIAFVLSLIFLGLTLVSAARKARGPRLVVCPETITPEIVRLDAGHAAWTYLSAGQRFRVASCTRGTRRFSCAEQCLSQIETAQDGCRVEERLARWQFDTSPRAGRRMHRWGHGSRETLESLDRALAGDLAGSSPLAESRKRG